MSSDAASGKTTSTSALLDDARRRAVRYLDTLASRPVAAPASAVERLEALREPLPESPTDPAEVLALLDEYVSPATIATAGPRFFGFVIGGSLPAALAANWLAAAWDQNAAFAKVTPGVALVEQVALDWLVDLLGLPAGTEGSFITGATVANFTALAAARHAVLADVGWNVEAEGLFGAPPITVVIGDEAHPTLLKSLGLLGLGRTRLVRVPVDAQGRMRADAFVETLARLDGPLIVCVQAGNVSTGASDPMHAIIPAAHARGAWVHVDGAFGLWANAVPELAPQVAGVAAADSWATDALKAAERGLPIARRHQDRRTELALTNNAGLAKIGLKRVDDGLRDLARVEELAQAAGLGALRAEVLREYDEALAAAGDARGALALFHRERAISAEVMRAHREAALKQLQERNHAERQQRNIELLARDNQLKAATLANRDLMQKVWALAALVLLLAAAAVLMVYRRMRATQRQLQSNQASLRVQSERDPLTNLANRRHFLSVMQTSRALGGGFEGALLLVDIDHFKHVNDGHGHAAGDLVLCEVARRLTEAVRGDDLVVRWGGEEFLVLALQVPTEQAEQLAERVLSHVGDRPVIVQGKPVRVTVSIGYARFPLPPDVLPVAWEQAINLADMALYTAKNQGRNRAVGIVAAQAPSPPDLRHIEGDFDRAWHEGRVTLKVAPGPMALAG